MLDRLTYAEINLKNFQYNFSQVKKLVGPEVKIMSIVKAIAYGHGAVEIARNAEETGASYFGVVCLYEARQLRQNGIKLPILILNYTDTDSLNDCLDLDITLNIMHENILKSLDKLAGKKNKKAKIHVKIDSGMHRLGLMPDEALKFIPKIENYKNIILEGIFTHFATSDEADLDFTYEQLKTFKKVINTLAERKIRPRFIHAANSAAILRFPESYFNMVRPGIIQYGMLPSGDFKPPFTPKPVMSLKSRIVQIRKIGKGETVGYGRTFTAKKETLVGAIPVGYADGFRRSPNNWGQVLVKGKFAPLLGRVSMDQSSIDLTGIPDVKVGDEVVLIGTQGKNRITAESAAKTIGTINYEVTSAIASRVSRKYLKE